MSWPWTDPCCSVPSPRPPGSCSLVVGSRVDCKSHAGSTRCLSRTGRNRRRRCKCASATLPLVPGAPRGTKENRAALGNGLPGLLHECRCQLSCDGGTLQTSDRGFPWRTGRRQTASDALLAVRESRSSVRVVGEALPPPHWQASMVAASRANKSALSRSLSPWLFGTCTCRRHSRGCKSRTSSPSFSSAGGGTRGRSVFENPRPVCRVAKGRYAMTQEEHKWLGTRQAACGVEDFHGFYHIHTEHIIGKEKFEREARTQKGNMQACRNERLEEG